jgi:hypothetical protein
MVSHFLRYPLIASHLQPSIDEIEPASALSALIHQRHRLTSRIGTIQDAVTFLKQTQHGEETRTGCRNLRHIIRRIIITWIHISRTEGIITLFQIEWTTDRFAGSDIQQESAMFQPTTDKEAREQGERTDSHQNQMTNPVGIAWILTRRDSKATLRLYPETHQTVA